MQTKPFNRSVGTIIHIQNKPLVYKRSTDKYLMNCIVNGTSHERIPLSFFKRTYGSSFSQRIACCQRNEELYGLLQGKTFRITAKTSKGRTFELIDKTPIDKKMKPFFRSVFHGWVGLLTWVVLTYVVCELFYVANNPRSRIFFLILAAALCWITSFRNTRRWERWAYPGVLAGAFLISYCGYLIGFLYATCLTCVTVSSFRSESRCSNLFRHQSKLTTRIITVLYWIWVAIVSVAIIPMTIDFYRDFILYI